MSMLEDTLSVEFVPPAYVDVPGHPSRQTTSPKRRTKDRAYYLKNRKKIIARVKGWRKNNLKKVRASDHARYRENRKEIIARTSAYAKNNREKVNKACRAYRARRPDLIQQIHARYAAKHPDKIRMKDKQYRARRRGAPINDFTEQQWQEIKAHYGHRCVYCHRKMARLTMDHITPLSKGGSHTASNIVPACRSCNARKHNRAPLCPVQPLLLTMASAKAHV